LKPDDRYEKALLFACQHCNCESHLELRAEIILHPNRVAATYERIIQENHTFYDGSVIQGWPEIKDRKPGMGWLGKPTYKGCTEAAIRCTEAAILRRVAYFLAIQCSCEGHEQVRHHWARGDQDGFAACMLFDEMLTENLVSEHRKDTDGA